MLYLYTLNQFYGFNILNSRWYIFRGNRNRTDTFNYQIKQILMKIHIKKSDIEKSRKLWSGVAKKAGWYKEPFFVQVWVNDNGKIVNSVSTIPMDKDYICSDTTEKILKKNEYSIIDN